MRNRLLQGSWLIPGALFALLFQVIIFPAHAATPTGMVVLLPDEVDQSDTRAMAWRDAADEEGLQLSFMSDSEFLTLGQQVFNYSGFIMPDQVHQKASDELVQALEEYVSKGGSLMLVYDAGALLPNGLYPASFDPDNPESSRFSDLVGVEYVFHEEFYPDRLNDLVGFGPVLGVEKMLRKLQVPPGKSMPFAGLPLIDEPTYIPSNEYDPGGLKRFNLQKQRKLKFKKRLFGAQPGASYKLVPGLYVDHGLYWPVDDLHKHYSDLEAVASTRETSVTDEDLPLPVPVLTSNDIHGVSGYLFGFLDYPSYLTRGEYEGDVLLTSPDYGLVAGVNSFGEGQVLFVNLSLSYLKGQTDGMLMHGFLRYFGETMLGMPRLANHPRGKGGLVFNWHYDDEAANQAIYQLDTMGVWDQGPYSIHITAGPDVEFVGDGLGANVLNNLETQAWLRYFDEMGHQVGSHGGWIHNYFGMNANEDNREEFEQYLVLNHEAVDGLLQRKSTEYSAPQGNNPLWAVNWLQNYGIRGYYFAGHTGMGPTVTYRDGEPKNRGLWAFPVAPFGEFATFEEFEAYGVSDAEVIEWYSALMDFAVYNRTSRLIYAHPPGAADHPDVIKALLDRAAAYNDNGHFEWYTMTDLAKFMSKRDKVVWKVLDDNLGHHLFGAVHPKSLRGQTWLLPKRSYDQPSIILGRAKIRHDSLNWIVSARGGVGLLFKAKTVD